MYINRGLLLKLIILGKRKFSFLNKHFYIILIISSLSKFINHKYIKIFRWLIKCFVIANIIFGFAYVIYFSVSEHSLINGLSIYYDLIKYHISNLIDLWNDLINIESLNNVNYPWNKDQINQIGQIKDQYAQMDQIKEGIREALSKDSINIQVKEGMKDALKDVIDEALNNPELQDNSNSNTLKNIAFITSVSFLFYFIFILPGNTDALSHYNWFNQSLIEFKVNIINLFSNPGNPGNPGAPTNNVVVDSPINPTSDNLNKYFRNFKKL